MYFWILTKTVGEINLTFMTISLLYSIIQYQFHRYKSLNNPLLSKYEWTPEADQSNLNEYTKTHNENSYCNCTLSK